MQMPFDCQIIVIPMPGYIHKHIHTCIHMQMPFDCEIIVIPMPGYIHKHTHTCIHMQMPFDCEIIVIPMPGQVLSDAVAYSRQKSFLDPPERWV